MATFNEWIRPTNFSPTSFFCFYSVISSFDLLPGNVMTQYVTVCCLIIARGPYNVPIDHVRLVR